MRPIMPAELDGAIGAGADLILVDDHARNPGRTSTLHLAGCRSLRGVGRATPLRRAGSLREAVPWLTRERGEEGRGWRYCPACRRRLSAEIREVSVVRRAPGETVWTTDGRRDLACVVGESAADPWAVEVTAFDAPSAPRVARRDVPLAATARFQPAAGDRCFVERDGTWHAARCAAAPAGEDDPAPLSLKLEEDGELVEVPASSVRFRRLTPLADPLAELAEQRAGAAPRFRARARLERLALELAAPSRGLLGILSAAVDLHPHQVGVARRVLADPVQRYLLADEVGLGKTIEAGLVVRQRLIDAPRSVIVVLVPSALVWQWEQELDGKLGLSRLRRGGVDVVGFDDRRAFDRVSTPDLVVIDEAHRIAAGCGSPVPELAERYEAARVLAHRVPRLLLLSATPVLHRERDLLAMLHLLDPDAYRLEDADAFAARVRGREQVAELALALRPGTPAFLLRGRLPELRAGFPGDARLAALLDRVERSLDGAAQEREAAVADARAHIGETHRLHRRLLRNRRTGIDMSSYAVRGRAGVVTLADGDPRRAAVDAWLERWRTTLLADAWEHGGGDLLDAAEQAFRATLACATGDLETLRELATYRLTRRRAARDAAGLGAEAAAALRAVALSDAQRRVLEDLLALLGDEPSPSERGRRIAAQVAALATGAIVVFATAPATVAALAAALAEQCPAIPVHACTAPLGDAERQAAIRAFGEGAGPRLLLCDASAEEGLNLQAADCVVHVDLPLSATRVEQRIGRADRHGHAVPVRSAVLDAVPADGFTAWWQHALRDAFRVFEQTTAPSQYAIESVERALLRQLFAEGVEDARAALASAAEQVVAEQALIDRLDGLDALAHAETDDVAFVEDVLAAEQRLAGDLARAVAETLRAEHDELGAHMSERPGGGRDVELAAAPPPLRTFPVLQEGPVAVTAERSLARRDEALGLLRPGAPLVDALRLQQAWDERAQTCAIWVGDPAASELRVAVRCDFVVWADPSAAFAHWTGLEAARPRAASARRTDADAPLALGALQRRIDAYLPPAAVSVWVDGDGVPLDPPGCAAFERALDAAPAQERWSDARWAAVARQAGAASVADLLVRVRRTAGRVALERGRDDGAAAERARADWAEAERLLTLRAELNAGEQAAQRDLVAERAVADLLLAALREPVARWSGACLAVLAPATEPSSA